MEACIPRPWGSGRSAQGRWWGSHVVRQQEQTLGIRLCVGRWVGSHSCWLLPSHQYFQNIHHVSGSVTEGFCIPH